VSTTAQIAAHTSTETNAIGFAGRSATRSTNRPLALAAGSAGPFIAPTTAAIRDFSYPLARRLYMISVSDGREPSDAEQALLDKVTDRSFMDPILEANDLVTCPPDGCP
jgi:ABC-type phosphate transport system substrate-binding protein